MVSRHAVRRKARWTSWSTTRQRRPVDDATAASACRCRSRSGRRTSCRPWHTPSSSPFVLLPPTSYFPVPRDPNHWSRPPLDDPRCADVRRRGTCRVRRRRPDRRRAWSAEARRAESRISNTSVAKPPRAPATSRTAVVTIDVTWPTVLAAASTASWTASLRISFLLRWSCCVHGHHGQAASASPRRRGRIVGPGLPVGQREAADLPRDAEQLLAERAGVVVEPVALADLTDLLGASAGSAAPGCPGTGGARSGATGCRSSRGTACRR